MKHKVIVGLFLLLLLISSYQALQVQSAVLTTTIVITIVGVSTVSATITISQLNNLISILASSRFAPLFPRPLTDPNAPTLKRWEIEIRPDTFDTGRKMKDEIDRELLTKSIEIIGNTIKRYIDEKRAGISRVEYVYDSTGYYLFITETKIVNGFRETYLKWARWPKETVSVILIGRRDITAPSISISSPNGGESWKVGETKRITWSASDNDRVHYVDIFYSTDGGKTWIPLATKVDNTGYYDWKIPPVQCTRCLVKIDVYDVAGNKASDTSDKSFTIVKDVSPRDTSPPTVKVTSPNGGEVLKVWRTQTIRWSASDNIGVTTIDIFYSTDGGKTWRTIVTGLTNTGSYTWRVPDTPSKNCLIRVDAYDASRNRGSDTSDKPFTIER